MIAPPMPPINHAYRAAALTLHDGDTFHARIALFPNLFYESRIRLARCNAPEIATPAGIVAAQFTAAWLSKAGTATWPLVIVSSTLDNYGRVLAEVFNAATGANLSDDLIAAGMAVPMTLAAQLAPLP